MIPGKTYNLQDLLDAAWRRRWLIAIPFALITAASVVVVRALPALYRSEAMIQVVPPTVPDTYLRSTVQGRIEDRLPAIAQRVMTRRNLEQIILDFDLYPHERATVAMENLVARMRRDIAFSVVDGEVIRLGYTARLPDTALQVATRLTTLFLDGNAKDREGQANAARDFLQVQLEDARRRLADTERALSAFRIRYAGQLPSEQAANLQVLNSALAQLQTMLDSINRDRDQRLFLERQLTDASTPDMAPAPAANLTASSGDASSIVPGGTAGEIEAARGVLKTMELHLTKDHPDVLRQKRTIERLEAGAEARAATEVQATARPTPGSPKSPVEVQWDRRRREIRTQIELIDRQLANKLGEERRLRATVAEHRERIEAAPTRESELTSLTRDYDTLQKVYASLLTKQEDAKMAANLEHREVGDRFRVIEPAVLPRTPLSRNRPLLLLFGMLAGLGIGAAIAAFVEYCDPSLRTEDDITTTLGVPVLATIPVLKSPRGRSRAAVRQGASA